MLKPPAGLHEQNLPSHLDALYSETARRVPVLSDENGNRFEGPDGYSKSRVLGAAMLRGVQNGSIGPDTFASLLDAPVSETLTRQAFELTADNPVVARAASLYPTAVEIVRLPEVPDEQIGPTLRGITVLPQFEDIHVFSKDPISKWYEIAEGLGAKDYTRGITRAEHALVSKRYQMAREIKLVALAEELSHADRQTDSNGLILLPSGTTVSIVAGKEAQARTLLDVQTWRTRTELHDRVFKITTTKGNFIMKEHKGGRHALTLDIPDMFTATSEQEVAIAADFAGLGTEDGDVRVSWEQAIGFVRDPSGFDFSIFEFENDLIPREKINDYLRAAITKQRVHYEAEYHVAQACMSDGQVLEWDDFADAKAYLLTQHAQQLSRKAMLENGYVDRDNTARNLPIPDHEYRVHESDTGIRLELVGMDYEHFERLSPDEAKRCKDRYNALIEENPIDTAGLLARGMQGTTLVAAQAIVSNLRAQGKRHLPEKL